MAGELNRDGSILFLSCDLQNSTQFKQTRSSGEWIATFLAFYTEFPDILSAKIDDSCRGLKGRLLLWKAIGDELIFSVRISSEQECSDAIDAWLAAMLTFENDHLINKTPMALKGGAFLATVPAPDRRVAIPRTVAKTSRSQRDSEAINEDSLNGAGNEATFNVDFAMDFVGPSIDTGFRVLKYASRRYFVLTAEVAHILFKHYSRMGENGRHAHLVGVHELKGVWGGRPYPVFAIQRDLEKSAEQVLSELFAGKIKVAEEYISCKPHDVIEAIEAYRCENDWRGAIHAPNSTWGAFQKHQPVLSERERLNNLGDTSEDPLDGRDDPGEQNSSEGMTIQ